MVSVAPAVEHLLTTVTLDDGGAAKAEIARTLAYKLDQTAASESATSALAVAGIAKELREVLDAILEATGEVEEFVAGLFAEVGNPAHA
jgi:hypothetical protein